MTKVSCFHVAIKKVVNDASSVINTRVNTNDDATKRQMIILTTDRHMVRTDSEKQRENNEAFSVAMMLADNNKQRGRVTVGNSFVDGFAGTKSISLIGKQKQ